MRINHGQRVGDDFFCRHGKSHGLECRRKRFILQHSPDSFEQLRINVARFVKESCTSFLSHSVNEQPIESIPAVEGIAVMRCKEKTFVAREAGIQNNGCRKASIQRENRLFSKARKNKFLRVFRQFEHAGANNARSRFSLKAHGHFLALCV